MISINDLKHVHKDMITYYKTLHACPELGFQEFRTSAFIAEKLKEFGLEVSTNVGRTGVVGILRGNTGEKVLMLRADIDALPIQEEQTLDYASKNPGVMHACGHDAHTAMLLGAAQYLSANRHLLKGTVKFVFQPAEEGPGPGGAVLMIKDGVLEGVDACLAIHVNSTAKTGQIMVGRKDIMASSDIFKIEIIGKGGHGAAPHQTIDPVPVLAELISAVNMIRAREIDPLDPCVVSIGTINTVSSTWNAIPERIELTGTFRTFSSEVREKINQRLSLICETLPVAHGCKAVYTRQKSYEPTINDPKMAEFVVAVAKKYLSENSVHLFEKPMTASEDVGAYFQKVPGAMIFIGCAQPDSEVMSAMHSPSFRVDLNALAAGAQIHINNVIAFFE